MIRLSIITPVYNSIYYIEKCIKNVIEQDASASIEHIIIDGASNDGTLDIIREYEQKFSHILLLSEKDTGQCNAMNKGIRLAQGDYISFLNVDDYYSENTLKEVIRLISSPSAPSFILGNCKVWDDKNNFTYINKPKNVTPWHIMAGINLPVNPSAYFYKKNIHEKTGFYNEDNHHNMDLEFLIKAASITPITYYDKDWGNFRIIPESKTGNDMTQNMLEKRKTELFKKYYSESPISTKIKVILMRLQKKIRSLLYRAKKAIQFPFDVIYWKFRKSIK